jgi:hypothetical protein
VVRQVSPYLLRSFASIENLYEVFMATVSLPKVPAKAWAILRSRAAAAPSIKFTPSAVAAMLGMSSPDSARDNILSHMRKLGLIDDDGGLTQRGNKWRIDSSYSDACQEIIDNVYPSELAVLVDDQNAPDIQKITTWMQHSGLGSSNARQMAATYVMIAQKNVPEAPSAQQKKVPKTAPAKALAKKSSTKVATDATPEVLNSPPAEPVHPTSNGPNIHLDIQIHIPVDASTEQIDQIFASMAKHLYQR